jgi:hypothetical protein
MAVQTFTSSDARNERRLPFFGMNIRNPGIIAALPVSGEIADMPPPRSRSSQARSRGLLLPPPPAL